MEGNSGSRQELGFLLRERRLHQLVHDISSTCKDGRGMIINSWIKTYTKQSFLFCSAVFPPHELHFYRNHEQTTLQEKDRLKKEEEGFLTEDSEDHRRSVQDGVAGASFQMNRHPVILLQERNMGNFNKHTEVRLDSITFIRALNVD